MRDRQITARLDAFCVRLLALEGVQQLHATAREPAAAELRRDMCEQLLCMAMLLNNSMELEELAASPLEARGPGSCGGFCVCQSDGFRPRRPQFVFERCCEEAFSCRRVLFCTGTATQATVPAAPDARLNN